MADLPSHRYRNLNQHFFCILLMSLFAALSIAAKPYAVYKIKVARFFNFSGLTLVLYAVFLWGLYHQTTPYFYPLRL